MSLDEGFSALAHPLRRDMLARLAGGPRTISEFTAGAGMTFAAVSRHLRVLERAGLVRRQVEGREHYFAAEPAGLATSRDWIEMQSRLWQQSLGALRQLVEDEMTFNNGLAAHAEIHISAPPERVFAAWLDPKKAARFLGAETSDIGALRLDPRPGGELYVAMVTADREFLHRGEFLVIDAPRRLVFTWLSQGTKLRTTVVAVDFVAQKGGTMVRLLHEGFADAADAEPHTHGWQTILDKLKTSI